MRLERKRPRNQKYISYEKGGKVTNKRDQIKQKRHVWETGNKGARDVTGYDEKKEKRKVNQGEAG